MEDDDEQKLLSSFMQFLDYQKSNKKNLSDLQISTIPKNPFTNYEMNKQSFELLKISSSKKSYHCKYCKSFPIIEIKDYNTIKVKCECEISEKSLDIMYKYRMTNIKSDENRKKLEEKLGCQKDNHNKEKYKYFCLKCNKNLCEKCYQECKKSPDHKEKPFLSFDKLKNEMSEKEKYIKDYFKKEYEIIINNRKYQSQIEKDKIKEDIRDKEGNIILYKKGDNNEYLDSINLKLLYSIINYDKDNFPNFNHFLNIENIYFYLLDKLEIEYSLINNKSQEIRLFGKYFVEKNKNNCYLIINNQREELREKYKIKNNEKNIKIILVKEKPIVTVSKMFYNCECLISIKTVNQWNMDKVKDMSYMFCGCISLNYLSSKLFSKWNTSEVKSFSYMFYNCRSLKRISGLNNFNTKNAVCLDNMFYECCNLKEIGKISGWITDNATDMSCMFYNCCELTEIDIYNWDFRNATKVNNMFHNCTSLKTIIFKETMNTGKVIDMRFMFTSCNNLEKGLIVLSNWNTQNVVYMNSMFENCINVKESFDVSKWDIYNVKEFELMFNNSSIKKPAWYD